VSSAPDTTDLLLALGKGDRGALDQLMPQVYQELRRIAHRELAKGRPGRTLQTTGLVHEAYLKLADQERLAVRDRAHFLAVAAKAMRHIVIDYARSRDTLKRGRGWSRVSLDEARLPAEARLAELIQLDEALTRLRRFDERLHEVVQCRYFGGMTVEETALALDMAPRTVDRVWQRAKAWLYREMYEA
jgi:RNA polymerase sigma factor (TIGR02999 family)